MPFVVDASVTLAWFLAGEATTYTETVLDLLRNAGAAVPGVWPLEVANTFLVAERRQRATAAESARSLDLLRALPITVDESPVTDIWESVLALARSQGLSVYDASYVELAMRRGLPLATLDDRMRAAAERTGVELVTVRDGGGPE